MGFGLLDSLFSPSTYGQGGLLSALQPWQSVDPSLGQQQPNQAQTMPDMTGANMIPIGGYMMPSFGLLSGGPQAAPSAPQSPLNANAQMPQAPQLAPQAAGAAPNGAPLPSFLQAPAPTTGPISQRLFDFAQRINGKDPVALRQQQQQELEQKRQLFQALAADPSIGPNKAMIAISNPQIFGQLQTAAHQAAQDAESKREFNLNYGLAQSREARANQSPAEAAAERAKAAQQFGVPPGTPEYNAYVLNGTLPDTTKAGGVKVLGKGGELYTVDDKGQPQILHKNQDNTDATLSDETVNGMADQYLAGDRTVLQNLGRGAQGAANVVKLREAIHSRALAAGIDPKGIVQNFNEQAGALAGQRAVGTRAANISLAANEANNMIPIALAASDKLPRSQYMPWNQMVQAVQKGSSSPELASFVAATNSLVNSYVRAVSPSGVPTDSMREHAYSMLNAAQGPEAYKAVINTMKQEMQAALQAPSQVKKELRGGEGGDQPAGAKSDPLGIR